jgi:hypothetical protein
MAAGLISCDDYMDLGQLPADLWEMRLALTHDNAAALRGLA